MCIWLVCDDWPRCNIYTTRLAKLHALLGMYWEGVCVETRSNYYYYYFFFSGNFFGYYCYVQWPLFLGRTFVLLSIRRGGEWMRGTWGGRDMCCQLLDQLAQIVLKKTPMFSEKEAKFMGQ